MRLLFLCLFLLLSAPAHAQDRSYDLVPSGDYEPLKADILKESLLNFTLDVEFFTNMDTNREAEYFTIYIRETLPNTCGDFRHLREVPHTKLGEYKQRFDLRGHADLIDALRDEGCVIVYNVLKY